MSIINQVYKNDIGRWAGPVYVAGETYTFYLNLNYPTSDPDYGNFRLNIYKHGDTTTPIVVNLGNVFVDMIDPVNGFYNLYGQFEFPSLPFGWYQFAIVNIVTGLVKVVSNPIYTDDEEVVKSTTIISYRNSVNKYGVNFEGLPDFYMRVRLPLIEMEVQFETERTQYRNVSNRKLRNYRNYKDDVRKLQGYKLDERMHRALSCVFDHDTIFLNSSFVTAKDSYNINNELRSVISSGEISVIVDDSVQLPENLISLVREFDPTEFSSEFQ